MCLVEVLIFLQELSLASGNPKMSREIVVRYSARTLKIVGLSSRT